MNYPAREGLQHVSHDIPEGLQHISHDEPEGLHHDSRSAYEKPQHKLSQNAIPDDPEHYMPATDVIQTKKARRICGLRKKWFWILVAVLIVVIAAGAVGGGVGGTIAGKNKMHSTESGKAKSSSPQTFTPTSTSSTVLSSSRTISQISTPTPSSTVLSLTRAGSQTSTPTLISSTLLSSMKAASSLPSTTTSSSSTTATTASATDLALSVLGCPASNGTSYTASISGSSTSYVFQKFCQQDLKSSSASSPSQDIQNMKMTNLNACIDACIQYNVDSRLGQTGAKSCVAVTFLGLISPWESVWNECYLKKRPEGGNFISSVRSEQDIFACAVLEGVKFEIIAPR
ncbi:uncharacterized protein RAG0_04819 [Rhynchosporium agropyri]|uniref:Apple domain-containing protein n=1 Tax=Rhynchosporium agropyri TaxID=914238 RepID=A0A1E1KE59_9HELO|nr:uncharacterized protein RAG0_04819 [Rhynchosporium agropyri]